MSCHKPKERSEEFLAEVRHRWRLNDLGQLEVNNKYPRSGNPGDIFEGGCNSSGYKVIWVGTCVQKHHVVWYLHTGEWPKQPLDHIDGDKTNNHPENLRLSSNKHNSRSYKKVWKGASSKFRGVYWNKLRKVWRSSIMTEGKLHHLGTFTCEKEAALAYNYAAIEHGYSPEAFNQVFADDEVEVT